MIRPLEAFIALRYVFSRQAGFFVSFMTWVSMLGVCVGVIALITILSVMNGFESELRGRLLSLSAHGTLTAVDGRRGSWEALQQRLAQDPQSPLTGFAPYIELQALLSYGSEMSGAMVRGIDPGRESGVSSIARSMKEGKLADLTPGSDRVILGRVLATQVGAAVGDTVTLLIPRGNEQTGEIVPRIRNFTVTGIFEVGLQDHDSVLALVHLEDARAFEGARDPGALTGLRLKFQDPLRAPEYAAHLAQIAGPDFKVRDWTIENAAYFRAIRIEKMMMTLIMLLIVAVAAFNIVAMLVMVVRAKRTDIAILRTLGLKARNVLGIFMTQGLVIGWTGTVFGVIWGLLIASNVGTLVPWLERTLRFQIMDADVYYITRIPSEPHAADVIVIAAAAFLLTLLATLYPALRAAATQPAEALRYE